MKKIFKHIYKMLITIAKYVKSIFHDECHHCSCCKHNHESCGEKEKAND